MTAREKLSKIIDYHLRESKKNDHDVAARIGCSERYVEEFRTGKRVPDGHQWKKLCSMINRALWSSQALHKDAMQEQQDERDQLVRAIQRNGHTTRQPNGSVVTNFGDKLVAAATTAVEPKVKQVTASAPTPEQTVVQATAPTRRSYPAQPPGARSREAQWERYEYAKNLMRLRPAIDARGEDGLIFLVKQRFGCGIGDSTIQQIRSELEKERIDREVNARVEAIRKGVEPSKSAPVPAAAPAPEPPLVVAPDPLPTAAASNADSDVQAGVELILGAIPNLQRLTITVNEAGEASVDYDVKRVQVTTVSGKLTVRR